MDDRNFHCWGHRKFISGLAGKTVEEDTAYTTDKINSNFSNYSAWHLRSKQLPQHIASTRPALGAEELELVKAAFFTEPEDQSAWMYHRCTALDVVELLSMRQVVAGDRLVEE